MRVDPAHADVTLVELNVFNRHLPLVSGYMQAYADRDENIRNNVTTDLYSRNLKLDRKKILAELLDRNSNIYTFSVYMWNGKLVRYLAKEILEAKPEAQILLGGPQVKERGEDYMSPRFENLIVANGESEITYQEFLLEAALGDRDYSRVQGVSYYRDGEFASTTTPARLRDVNVIPSPYLNGYFDHLPVGSAVFETNRGCPYKCSFCYFSEMDKGTKITKFDLDRIKDEIEWLGKRYCGFIFFADANLGIFDRDVEIAEHIVAVKKKYRLPKMIFFASAKNRPDRITEITRIFVDGGLVTTQPVSYQSMSEDVLELIGRKNIKGSKAVELQNTLIETGVPSYAELIWPLPGETLESFEQGIEELCERKVDTITMFPLVLLNGTKLLTERDKWGLETAVVEDEIVEAEIVIGTDTVGRADCREGHRFYYAAHALYNCCALGITTRYLHAERGVPFKQTFRAFSEYAKGFPASCFTSFVESGLEKNRLWDNTLTTGALAHIVLHESREGFADLVHGFVSSQDWWDDESRQAFELDLFNTLHIYNNTPFSQAAFFEKYIEDARLLRQERDGYTLEVTPFQQDLIRRFADRSELGDAPESAVHCKHEKRVQLGFTTDEDGPEYCGGMIERSRDLVPVWVPGRP